MTWPQISPEMDLIIGAALMVAFLGLVAMVLLTRWAGRKKYDVEAVIRSDIANYHIRQVVENPNFKIDWGGTGYLVRQEGFFKMPRGALKHLKDFFRGVKARYLIMFWEGQAGHIVQPDPTVGPLILERVRTSRVLRKALAEMFRESLLGGKGIIFVVIVFVAVAIVILRTVGYLP